MNERTEYVRVGGTLSYDRRRQEPLQIRGYSLAASWRYNEGVGETASTKIVNATCASPSTRSSPKRPQSA